MILKMLSGGSPFVPKFFLGTRRFLVMEKGGAPLRALLAAPHIRGGLSGLKYSSTKLR
jgi:hypothetical protein